jgi:hypothetical protein
LVTGEHDTIATERLHSLAAYSRCRPKPARRVAPKQPDGESSFFLFGFYEAALRDLMDPATTGRSPGAPRRGRGDQLNDRFLAPSLRLSSASSGHELRFASGSFAAVHQCALTIAVILGRANARQHPVPPRARSAARSALFLAIVYVNSQRL